MPRSVSKIGTINASVFVSRTDDFRLVRTETNAIGLDSAFTITPENDQYFYSLYDSSEVYGIQ